jgi:hypothetical protein
MVLFFSAFLYIAPVFCQVYPITRLTLLTLCNISSSLTPSLTRPGKLTPYFAPYQAVRFRQRGCLFCCSYDYRLTVPTSSLTISIWYKLGLPGANPPPASSRRRCCFCCKRMGTAFDGARSRVEALMPLLVPSGCGARFSWTSMLPRRRGGSTRIGV